MTEHDSPILKFVGDTFTEFIATASADDRTLNTTQLITKFLAVLFALVSVFTAFYYVLVGVFSFAQHMLDADHRAGRLPRLAVLIVLCLLAFVLFWEVLVRARVGVTWRGVAEERIIGRRDEEHGGDGRRAGRSTRSLAMGL